jgi:hypothetical protein
VVRKDYGGRMCHLVSHTGVAGALFTRAAGLLDGSGLQE